LAALPAEIGARILPALELVPMPLGLVLHEPGQRMSYAYFPTSAIVSLLYVMADGASAEIAVIGNDGIVGVSLFMGGETTTSRAVVQSAGHAYRLDGRLLKGEFNRAGGRRAIALQHLLLRYTQALLTQMAQTAVCNRHHSVDQQRRHRGGREIAAGRPDPLQPRQDHGAGPARPGGARVRVLRRGQERGRSPAPGGRRPSGLGAIAGYGCGLTCPRPACSVRQRPDKRPVSFYALT